MMWIVALVGLVVFWMVFSKVFTGSWDPRRGAGLESIETKLKDVRKRAEREARQPEREGR